MSLFERLFGKQPATAEQTSSRPQVPAALPVKADQVPDAGATEELQRLFAVAREQREEEWVRRFYDVAGSAAVTVPEQPVFEGPDFFPYVRLDLAPAGADKVTCLANLARRCVENGWGAAFFPEPQADIAAVRHVLSTGLLDSLLRFGTWTGDPLDAEAEIPAGGRKSSIEPLTRSEHGTLQAIHAPEERQILIGTPSAEYLPPYTARNLYHHLSRGWKLDNPRVALLIDPTMRPSRSLVIGKKLSDFPDAETAGDQVSLLLWHLPPGRSLVLLPESWTLDQLTPLAELGGNKFPAE